MIKLIYIVIVHEFILTERKEGGSRNDSLTISMFRLQVNDSSLLFHVDLINDSRLYFHLKEEKIYSR